MKPTKDPQPDFINKMAWNRTSFKFYAMRLMAERCWGGDAPWYFFLFALQSPYGATFGGL